MKAVNLLIADDPRLVFILGMDREKVAAGLAVKYEKLLPCLISLVADTAETTELKYRDGLAFGHAFLQKFIQLPFRVPEPNPGNYREFIKTISTPVKMSNQRIEIPISRPIKSEFQPKTQGQGKSEPLDAPAEIPSTPPPTPAQVQVRRQRELRFGGDSDTVQAVALMVADTLGRNPRRLKQFVNLFRLQAYIANEIGLFDRDPMGSTPITLEQLGKFVAISLWWPALLADFADDPTLLGKLEEFADGDPRAGSTTEKRWLSEPRIKKFLRYGIKEQKEKYTLSNPSLFQLLHICPQRVKTPVPAQLSVGSSS
jgi:hypothetical protein